MKNIIFIEGVSGVGKSTTATVLCEELRNLGYIATCYLEGDSSCPVDLCWVAYLDKAEYKNLTLSHPEFADELSKNSIIKNDYVLVRYQNGQSKLYSPEIYDYLKNYEFCYRPANPVTLSKYTEVFLNLWWCFTESQEVKRDYIILDGSLLHHQINDLIRNYNASEDEIAGHLTALLQTVKPLNPIVFYLSSQDVGDRLMKARKSRRQTDATADQIEFCKNRKRMDFDMIDRLIVESHIVDISSDNWDLAVDMMLSRIVKDGAVIHHYDALINENNDPVHDPAPLWEYMDKWDGQAFIDELQLSPDKNVLEIGVGTGRLAVRVCGQCKQFTGIDISPKTIERASDNLKGFDNATLICTDFTDYDFSNSSLSGIYDTVYSSLTFMHIRDKQKAVKIVTDLLKPGGRFVLSVSKEQSEWIEYGDRKIYVFPDQPDEITALIKRSGLHLEKQFETEFAYVFVAVKE